MKLRGHLRVLTRSVMFIAVRGSSATCLPIVNPQEDP